MSWEVKAGPGGNGRSGDRENKKRKGKGKVESFEKKKLREV